MPDGNAIWEWMLRNPSDVLLAFAEAGNVDTYGIKWVDHKPEREVSLEEMQNYLRERIPEMMTWETNRPEVITSPLGSGLA